MNVLVALMITKTDEQDAQISLIKQRIEEISGTTDVITKFVLGIPGLKWVLACMFCGKQENSKVSYQPERVCLTSNKHHENGSFFQHLQDGLDNTNFLGFKAYSHYWVVGDHTSSGSSTCENLGPGEFKIGKRLVDLTIRMLRKKENDKIEMMEIVQKFQDDTEKELRKMLDNDEGELLLDENEKTSYESRLNKIDMRYEKLEATLKEILAKLDKLMK